MGELKIKNFYLFINYKFLNKVLFIKIKVKSLLNSSHFKNFYFFLSISSIINISLLGLIEYSNLHLPFLIFTILFSFEILLNLFALGINGNLLF